MIETLQKYMKKKSDEFQRNSEYRIRRIRHFAKKYGWKELAATRHILLFGRDKNRQLENLEISVSTLRITTAIQHPKHGSTKLVRKGSFTERTVESIFRNPRQHTGRAIKSEYVRR